MEKYSLETKLANNLLIHLHPGKYMYVDNRKYKKLMTWKWMIIVSGNGLVAIDGEHLEESRKVLDDNSKLHKHLSKSKQGKSLSSSLACLFLY